ncbi:MAG: ABC transporter permease, partial [Methanobacteriota archaeon]
RAFTQTDRFDLIGYLNSIEEVKTAIHSWEAQIALVIPPHFGKQLQRKQQPEIQLIADGLDGNTAGVALGYARSILSGISQRLLWSPAFRVKLKNVHLASMEERLWYNPNINNAQYMVPGIVVVLLTLIPSMLTAMSLVREKEIGTLEQLLVTPLKKQYLLMGKLLPFLILAIVEMILVLKAAEYIFDIRMQGSYTLLGGLALLYLFTTLGLGIMVSTITHTQQQAMFVSWFFMVFMLLMSGLFIPIENMPPVLQKITYLNPMRYFMYIIRDIFQKASTLPYLWKDILPMTILGVSIFSVSVLTFHKRVG